DAAFLGGPHRPPDRLPHRPVGGQQPAAATLVLIFPASSQSPARWRGFFVRARTVRRHQWPVCLLSENAEEPGAGEGNRTLVVSLGSFCSTIELHPREPHFWFIGPPLVKPLARRRSTPALSFTLP